MPNSPDPDPQQAPGTKTLLFVGPSPTPVPQWAMKIPYEYAGAGKKIRAARLKQEMNQAKLAALLTQRLAQTEAPTKVTAQHVSQWEAGKKNIANPMAFYIAEVLGFDVSELRATKKDLTLNDLLVPASFHRVVRDDTGKDFFLHARDLRDAALLFYLSIRSDIAITVENRMGVTKRFSTALTEILPDQQSEEVL